MTLYFRHGRRVLQLSEAHFQCPVYLKKGRFFGTLINNNSNNTPKMVAPNHKFSTMLYPSQMLKRHVHMNMTMFESVTVDCPPFAESITEGDVRWEKEVGDAVEMDETVAEVETDKTGIPIQSPLAGTVEELLVEDGTTVQPGTPLFKISTDGAVAAATPKKESSPETPPVAPTESATPPIATPPPATPPPATQPPATPPPAEQVPIPQSLPPIPSIPTQPLVSVPTTKPKKIIEMPQPSVVDTAFSERSEHRSKMNRMRLRISQRLKDSQNTAAMLTTFNEVDMSNIMAFRSKYKDAFHKKHGIKLSFMSGFIKAAAYALKEQPVVNAVIDDAAKEIVYRDYVDISVAVATPKGLVVPVLRNCEGMNFLQVEREMNELAAKARNNQLTVEDMDGGTFTISNGGVFGSMFGTPIINPPQSAILGMHAIFDRPVAIKGEVKIRPMMYIALTYDHRLIDGREAVTFLKKIKEGVEDPLIFEIGM